MNGPARGTSPRKREPLRSNWHICATPPGALQQSAPPAAGNWIALETLLPVAAALRALQGWSLDAPTRRFDAEEWWYRVTFDAQPVIAGERTILGFDGLATIAQVWLNGQALLSSSNMFMAHELDVSGVLKPEANELLIRFSALDAELSLRRKRPRWRAPMIEHQQMRWVRTTLLGRTPGWSPPAAVVGPWKDIWLEQRSAFEVKHVVLDLRVEGSTGLVRCSFQASSGDAQDVETASLQLTRGARTVTACLTGRAAGGVVTGELCLPEVDLWWPHTHGEPALYQASLSIRLAGLAQERVIDLGRVGFRTITLDTAQGNFALAVNGVPIFCRGACWTPLDPVTLRSSAEACQAAVAQACTAGMNMLRVAGTMVYEEDHFYTACDEQGMLVWQDFMFANMDYPADDAEFLASASTEVRQQLQRRHANACLALWCGNSEVAQQAAMWGASRELWRAPLFDELLAQLCAEHAPGTPYWPSSAHGGSFPHQANEGSTSYYGVGAYLRPLDDARRANLKFATECLAFANVPAQSALARMPGGLATRVHHPGWKARSPRDLGAGWDFDDVRDHYLGVLFGVDPQKLRYSDHERYLTLSRMTTAEVMTASFSEWRRPEASCNGAMVLFLRDLWAGAGWGLLDDAGVPKACFHALKRVLQPVTVLMTDEGGNGLFVHLINERGEDKALELEINVWRQGAVLVATSRKDITLPAHSAQSLACLDGFEHFMDLTYAYRFGPLACEVTTVTLRDPEGGQVAQAFHFPDGMNARQEVDVGLSAQATMLDSQTAELTVRTRHLALGVHFDIPGFVAGDEYFHLAPNSEIRVHLSGMPTRPLAGTVCAVNSITEARVALVTQGSDNSPGSDNA